MKKRIRFEFEGKIYAVDVEKQGDRIIVNREGESFSVTLLPEEKEGIQKAVERTKSTEAPSDPILTTSAQGLNVSPEGQVHEPPVSTASPKGPGPVSYGPMQDEAGPGELLAPMTGLVKDLKVADGQNVEKGQVVMIMEAMKMDIDIQAPVSGVVREISVRQGDNINANQRLMRIQ